MTQVIDRGTQEEIFNKYKTTYQPGVPKSPKSMAILDILDTLDIAEAIVLNHGGYSCKTKAGGYIGSVCALIGMLTNHRKGQFFCRHTDKGEIIVCRKAKAVAK